MRNAAGIACGAHHDIAGRRDIATGRTADSRRRPDIVAMQPRDDLFDRPARRRLHDQEIERHDAEQSRNDQKQTTDDVSEHAASLGTSQPGINLGFWTFLGTDIKR